MNRSDTLMFEPSAASLEWLDAELANVDATIEEFVDRMIEQMQRDGEWAVPLDENTIANLRVGLKSAFECFLQRVRNPGCRLDKSVFVAHGRLQQIAGRSFSELLSLYRVGGLAAWRSFSTSPMVGRVSTESVLDFGEIVLHLVDELSLAAVEGFNEEQAERTRRWLSRRERLHSLMMSTPAADRGAITEAADAAGWEVPERVRVAVARLPANRPAGSSLAGPSRVVSGSIDGGRRALIVADGDDCESWLIRAAKATSLGSPLAVGPAVAPADAARSAHQAAALLEQLPPRGGGKIELVHCEDHEVDLMLTASKDLARAVANRVLEPLRTVAEPQRTRMTETLAAWLDNPGRPQAMAGQLGLHVQTVRYRLGQLREIFGDVLDDPDSRFELALAMRADVLTKQ